ncbi:hypothetical protein [Nocardioides dilutus]
MEGKIVEGPDAMGLLEVGLLAILGLAAIVALALGLSRPDPEPPARGGGELLSQQTSAPGEELEPPWFAESLTSTSSCRTDTAGTVTCADPGPFVETLEIRTYPTRQDLYAAYVREVEALTDRPFHGNVGDCSGSHSEGEVSWSLDRSKSRAFPLRLLRDGLLDPTTEAAGRVFCTSAGGQHATVVWTQDPFRLVTVTGSPAQRVTKWWVDVHIRLACGDDPSSCLG